MSERLARWYGEQRFAIAWTAGKHGNDAKRVLTKGWPSTESLADGDAAVAAFQTHLSSRNPAIVLRPSNLIGLDCDTEQGLDEIRSLGLPQTLTAQSSQPHKLHFYFRPPHDLEHIPYVAFRFEEDRVSADKERYLVCPPAVHPTGALYGFQLDEGMEIAELSADCYAALVTRARRERQEQRQRLQLVPGAKVRQGARRDSVFRYACMLRRWHSDDLDAIVEEAYRWNEQHCQPALSRSQVVAQVEGILKYPGGQEAAPLPEEPSRAGGTSTLELLDAVESLLCDYVVVDADARCALALWVLHTWTFAVQGDELVSASEVTPYIHVMSAAPGCGKSTLFEVIETVVARPKMVAAGITKASLVRSLHATCPTLLLDELDLLLKGDKEAATAIHQALNAGYRKRGVAETLVPTSGGGWEPQSFRVFSPKAFAGIGHVPHSLATRRIPVMLRPKMRDEKVKDKWEDVIWRETDRLRADLERWCAASRPTLGAMRELRMPAELHNRTREIWRPLWAIADLAGGSWPDRARSASIAIHTSHDQELDHRVLLLADVRDVFDQAGVDRLHTTQLLEALVAIEEHPWRGWWMDSYTGGLKTEAAYKLSNILKGYRIQPEPHAFAVRGVRARGYTKSVFEQAWKQYLTLPAVPGVSSVQTQTDSHAESTDNTDRTEQRRGHGWFKRLSGPTV